MNNGLFQSHNPATGEVVWEGPAATSADIDIAIYDSRLAFQRWSLLSVDGRIPYLEAFGQILTQEKKDLAEAISIETGKPLWESMQEVSSMIGKIPLSIQAYYERTGEKIQPQKIGRHTVRHKAHGIAAVLGPFNFPGHLPNGHIIPALLAGNTVIFKPSEYTPRVGEKILFCWEKAGLPKGVFQIVQGGKSVGQTLATHPDINALFFTGSFQVGKWLSEQFGSHPEKLLALEMGGNNPLVIGEIKDVKAAAYLTVQSAYITAGQRCSCARRLIVSEETNQEPYLKALIAMVKSIHVGHYKAQPEPFMGPVISPEAALKLLDVQANLKRRGGQILVEMKLLKNGTGLLSPGLMDVTKVEQRPDEEYFGPFLQVIRSANLNAAIQEANQTAFGLTAGLLSEKREEYDQFFQSVKAGIVNWNMPTTGASSAAPFGGTGKSGNYRPSAYYAADYCAYPVASFEVEHLKLPDELPVGLIVEPKT